MTGADLRWVDVSPEVWAQLRTAQDIRARKPYTLEQHLAEVAGGWLGSDGSSSSPDTIWGLRVGITTAEFRSEYSTWKHDAGYRAIRRLLRCRQISEPEVEELREVIDKQLRADLFEQIDAGTWWLRSLRYRRALKYFEGVRIGGGRALRMAMRGEFYPRIAPPRAA